MASRRARALAKRTYVELDGQEELRATIKAFNIDAIRAAKTVVADCAREIEREAKARIPVRAMNPGYFVNAKKMTLEPPGTTRSKVRIILRDAGLSASIGTLYYVARFLEFGTKFMAARPWLNPAFEIVRPKYVHRMREALERTAKAVA